MEVEKKRSKGGFLNFFDWNGKSRKKLFVNNSESHDGSKQGEENVENKTKSQLQMIETDESRASSSNKESSDFNCASSITSDGEYVTKAPSVVARLMGLDSMPTSNVSETCSISYFDLCSTRSSQLNQSNPNSWNKYQPAVDYPSFSSKLENFSWNSVESRSSKVPPNRPIDRFQTEVLPPRSAKPISITHHKLLSPIKSPGFFPSRDAKYIIEGAAKIIEASPQQTAKSKMLSIVNSPVPLRIRDLKEKMEAAHKASRSHNRPNEHCPVKRTKRQTGDNSKSSFKASTSSEKNSPERLRNKGKLVSQAMANVQRKEGSTSSSNNMSARKQKGKNDVKVNPLYKTQSDVQKNGQKGISSNRSNNVLRQNNQKQNHTPNKDSSVSGPSISKKAKAVNGSSETTRTVRKVVVLSETGSRKNGLVTAAHTEKKLSSSKRKDSNFEESVTGSMLRKKDQKSITGSVTADGQVKWDEDSRKKGMDIVSFTFTSPIKRSAPDFQPSNQVGEKFKNSADSPGYGGDSLNDILEQKLKELTSKVVSSHFNIVKEGNSTSFAASFHDLLDKHNVASTTGVESNRISQFGADEDKPECLREFDCSSIDEPGFVNSKWQLQHSEELGGNSISSNCEIEVEFDCRHSSPVSILETSSTSEGCFHMKNNGRGNEQYLAEAQVCGWLPTNDSTTGEYETELSDSASSISFCTKMPGLISFEDSNKWEFNNVKIIIANAELMLEEFALGQTDKVLTTPNHLENKENGDEEEKSKLGQKLLFDCVNESLESRCGEFSVGNRKAWGKCGASFQNKGRLSEEVYREIVSWRGMGDMMVDELVDKDMSTQNGRWLDFDLEAFEEGADIENGILTSLVDELFSDLII